MYKYALSFMDKGINQDRNGEKGGGVPGVMNIAKRPTTKRDMERGNGRTKEKREERGSFSWTV